MTVLELERKKTRRKKEAKPIQPAIPDLSLENEAALNTVQGLNIETLRGLVESIEFTEEIKPISKEYRLLSGKLAKEDKENQVNPRYAHKEKDVNFVYPKNDSSYWQFYEEYSREKTNSTRNNNHTQYSPKNLQEKDFQVIKEAAKEQIKALELAAQREKEERDRQEKISGRYMEYLGDDENGNPVMRPWAVSGPENPENIWEGTGIHETSLEDVRRIEAANEYGSVMEKAYENQKNPQYYEENGLQSPKVPFLTVVNGPAPTAAQKKRWGIFGGKEYIIPDQIPLIKALNEKLEKTEEKIKAQTYAVTAADLVEFMKLMKIEDENPKDITYSWLKPQDSGKEKVLQLKGFIGKVEFTLEILPDGKLHAVTNRHSLWGWSNELSIRKQLRDFEEQLASQLNKGLIIPWMASGIKTKDGLVYFDFTKKETSDKKKKEKQKTLPEIGPRKKEQDAAAADVPADDAAAAAPQAEVKESEKKGFWIFRKKASDKQSGVSASEGAVPVPNAGKNTEAANQEQTPAEESQKPSEDKQTTSEPSENAENTISESPSVPDKTPEPLHPITPEREHYDRMHDSIGGISAEDAERMIAGSSSAQEQKQPETPETKNVAL